MKSPSSVPFLRSFKALTDIERRIKILDIGANPIQPPPYRPMLECGDVELVGFEPNTLALAKLNAAKGPHETYLPHAVADGGRHTLYLCAADGMSSLLKPNLAVLNQFRGYPEWAEIESMETIDTVRLDDVAETIGAHMVKIDIQGGELMVFQNARERLKDILLIETEVEFLEMYVGQPLFSEVEQFLRTQGFILHRFRPIASRVLSPLVIGQNIYRGLSQHIYTDAIFVKDFTKIERLSNDQLLSMARIVHDYCSSFDLALKLLLEYDKRLGTNIADSYFGKLSIEPFAMAA